MDSRRSCSPDVRPRRRGTGIGFESSVLCYFGSLAQSIRDIVSGDAQPQGPVVYALAGCSLLFCFLAAAFATVAVR